MDKRMELRGHVFPICPNPFGLCGAACIKCEQRWQDMTLINAKISRPAHPAGLQIRVCSCGMFWYPRLCGPCYSRELASGKADEVFDFKAEMAVMDREGADEQIEGRP